MELDNLPVIDWELGVKLAGNKKDLAEEMLVLLKQCLPQDVSMIMQLYETQNQHELLRSVHRLLGAVCYCGVPRLKRVLAHLESTLKKNINTHSPSLLNQLTVEAGLVLAHDSRQQS